MALVILCIGGTAVAQPTGEHGNLPLPAPEVERRMAREPFAIAAVDGAGGGVMGARKLRLVFRDGVRLDAKWKESARGGEGWNNAPRREIAAYRVQQLFLDPDDFLVPPVVARCIAFDTYQPVDDDPKAAFDGTRCAFGTLSAWLDNITVPDHAFDAERFSTDRRYAYHFANLNLLTYLIDHRDARKGNLLMSKDSANPQVFSVDNGIAFGHVLFNFFALHLNRLVVGGVPRQSLERLRHVTRTDLDRLGVLGELRVDQNGVLRSVPPSANVAPNEGERALADGIQFGLTTEEIDAIEERLDQLRVRAGDGELATF
jgi:hypothetical protein